MPMWWAIALVSASADLSGQGLALPAEEGAVEGAWSDPPSGLAVEESPAEEDWSKGPICNWAQDILVAQCNSQHPDTPTGCAAGRIEGQPFSGQPTTADILCLTANQPFVHFGYPICQTAVKSGGTVEASFECQWLIQPAGYAAIGAAALIFGLGCYACVCRRFCRPRRE